MEPMPALDEAPKVPEAKPEASEAGSPPPEATKEAVEQDRLTGLSIVNRTTPKEVWEAEVAKQTTRLVQIRHIPVYCSGKNRQAKDNIIVGVLFDTAGEKLGNGEAFLKWRLTDMAQPEPRNMVLHLRWKACAHWRKAENAQTAQRGAIMAIMSPRLLDTTSVFAKDQIVFIENPNQVQKLGDCPDLGTCKKKGCKLPCNVVQKEAYCKLHLNALYASKSVRITVGGGADAKVAAFLADTRKRAGAKLFRASKARKEEAEEAGDERARAEEERKKKLELALHLDDRRFNTAEANDSYIKFVRKGLKAEESTISRVPQLGRGLDESSVFEVIVPSLGKGP